MQTIAIMGLKGGVGKTTAAINIASELAADGQRVLLLELSKQGNIGRFFGASKTDGMAAVLTGAKMADVIEHTEHEGLDMVASDMSILTAEPGALTLKKALDGIDKDYDFAVIDCEPTFDAATITAIMAADKIYTPLRPDQYSIDAAKELFGQIAQVDKSKIGGAFVPAIGNSKADQEALAAIKKQIEIMPVMIHKSPKVERMSWARQPVNILSPRSKAAKEYGDLTGQIISDLWLLSDSDN